MLVVSGMFFAFDLVSWHWSIRYTSVTNATFLANLAPIVVTVAAWLIFRERITTTFLSGMALSLVGAALLVRASLSFGGSHPLGDALGVLDRVLLRRLSADREGSAPDHGDGSADGLEQPW